MTRLLLIANPAASGFTGALHRDVVHLLADAYDVAPVWPDSADQARQAAAHAAERGFDVVAAMGGDGVLHYVANGLAGTGIPLGIIPTGTTNVLARILGLPGKPRAAARHLAESATAHPVDLAHVVTESPDGSERSFYGLFAVGLGFDAAVVDEAERQPHRKLHFGGLYYARSAVGTAAKFRHRQPTLRVEAEGRRAFGVAAMVQVHDTYTYLGPRRIGLHPGANEGLTALVLPRVSLKAAAALAPRLLSGRTLDGAGGAETWPRLAKLVVEAEPPVLLQADGELIGPTTGVEISAAHGELWVAGLAEPD